jgi:hypothetical protein
MLLPFTTFPLAVFLKNFRCTCSASSYERFRIDISTIPRFGKRSDRLGFQPFPELVLGCPLFETVAVEGSVRTMLDRLTSKRSLLTFGLIGFIFFLTHLGHPSPDYLDMRPSPPPSPKPTNPVIPDDDKDFHTQISRVRPTDKLPHSRTLGIADAIYVISLARRTDRREIMDSIADALGLDFTYVDATDFKEPSGKAIIDNIRDRVRWQRNRIDDRDALPSDWPKADYSKSKIYVHNAFPFKWSADVEENKDDPLAKPLGVYGADYWDMYPLNEEYERTHPLPPWTEAERKAHVMEASVMNNQNVERWLTEAGFACWHSHHKTLREIVRKSENMANRNLSSSLMNFQS